MPARVATNSSGPRSGNLDVDDPDSLDRPGVSVVRTRGADYPEDAPTIAVRDLADLGIDLSDFATGAGAPERAHAPALDPAMVHKPQGVTRPLVVTKVNVRPHSSGPPTAFFVAAAVVPVLAAAAIAALIMFSA